MSKYHPLGAYLQDQPTSSVPMTFEDIERVIGFPLPPVAKTARAWWSNNPSNNVMTKVWIAAGFRSEQVDMASERLVFRREGGAPDPVSRAPRSDHRHALFGCLAGTVTIAPDLDLSAPVEAAWGESAK